MARITFLYRQKEEVQRPDVQPGFQHVLVEAVCSSSAVSILPPHAWEDHGDPLVPHPEDHEDPLVPHPEDHEDPLVPHPEDQEELLVPHPEDHEELLVPHPEDHEELLVPHPEDHEELLVPHPEDHEDPLVPHPRRLRVHQGDGAGSPTLMLGPRTLR
ncbi:microtubule-associated protein 6-like [Cololabis saira]|uniref:microtubule-associated protein 6-like n=1 Tax=Cololabis saira TaxID=129043 RepID=UPI002AD4CE59|nr:microtubule-associated protein 6-like [Cololabis saira]XP_061580397.1 microtubule-associated protein 6-like [Cololabis saira]XP_061580398.1 microtubule-associated protein 6-like [Cololabis saira]XP_061580399.1 microtubule-associated protein 6-like [Cololabis saira]